MSTLVIEDLRSSFNSEAEMLLFLVEERKSEYFEQFRKAAAMKQMPQRVLDHLLVFSDDEAEARLWLGYGAMPQANNSACILGPAEWAELDHIKLLVQAGAKPTMAHVEAATGNINSAVAHYLLDYYMSADSQQRQTLQATKSLASRKRPHHEMTD